MTPRETDHIGNQAVLAMQSMVGLLIDGGLPVPAERLQRLLDKLARVGRGEFALCFILRNQRQAAGGEDFAPREDRLGPLAQGAIFNQLQAQQRGENPKWIARQRGIVDGTKRRGVDRHAGLREIVIANGIHSHDGKHATERRQFFRCAHANRAVALHV